MTRILESRRARGWPFEWSCGHSRAMGNDCFPPGFTSSRSRSLPLSSPLFMRFCPPNVLIINSLPKWWDTHKNDPTYRALAPPANLRNHLIINRFLYPWWCLPIRSATSGRIGRNGGDCPQREVLTGLTFLRLWPEQTSLNQVGRSLALRRNCSRRDNGGAGELFPLQLCRSLAKSDGLAHGQMLIGCDLIVRRDDEPLVRQRIGDLLHLASSLEWFFPLRKALVV